LKSELHDTFVCQDNYASRDKSFNLVFLADLDAMSVNIVEIMVFKTKEECQTYSIEFCSSYVEYERYGKK